MVTRQEVQEQVRKLQYWFDQATDRPWKRGIGNDSCKIFAERKGGLLAESYNPVDAYLMAYAPQELEYLMDVVDDLYDKLEQIAYAKDELIPEDTARNMRSLALAALGLDKK